MVSPFGTSSRNGVLSCSDHFVQPDDGNQCCRFQNDLPVIADPGQSETHHLRKENATEDLPATESVGGSGFELSFRNSKYAAPKSLGKVSAINKSEDTDPGEEGVYINLLKIESVCEPIQPILEAVVEQE